MVPTPHRRWFRFSLRTLFVAVTLFACWLGWQMKFIRDRKEMRQWIVAQGGHTGNFGDPFADDLFNEESEEIAPPIPWLRQILGDEGIGYIELPRKSSSADRNRIAALFPEANILPWEVETPFEFGTTVTGYDAPDDAVHEAANKKPSIHRQAIPLDLESLRGRDKTLLNDLPHTR